MHTQCVLHVFSLYVPCVFPVCSLCFPCMLPVFSPCAPKKHFLFIPKTKVDQNYAKRMLVEPIWCFANIFGELGVFLSKTVSQVQFTKTIVLSALCVFIFLFSKFVISSDSLKTSKIHEKTVKN